MSVRVDRVDCIILLMWNGSQDMTERKITFISYLDGVAFYVFCEQLFNLLFQKLLVEQMCMQTANRKLSPAIHLVSFLNKRVSTPHLLIDFDCCAAFSGTVNIFTSLYLYQSIHWLLQNCKFRCNLIWNIYHRL